MPGPFQQRDAEVQNRGEDEKQHPAQPQYGLLQGFAASLSRQVQLVAHASSPVPAGGGSSGEPPAVRSQADSAVRGQILSGDGGFSGGVHGSLAGERSRRWSGASARGVRADPGRYSAAP